MTECAICRVILEPSLPWKVYETEHVAAVLESCPMHKGHTLVFPKKHYNTLMDMQLDDVAEFFKSVTIIAQALRNLPGVEGITLIQGNGQYGWQNIPHVYVNVIPRCQDDRIKIEHPSGRISDEMQEKVWQSLVKEINQVVALEAS